MSFQGINDFVNLLFGDVLYYYDMSKFSTKVFIIFFVKACLQH